MKPLEGILVVDLSRVLAGPLCAMRLADLGARVIKVEAPDLDPTRRYGPPFVGSESAYFLAYNRGKEGIVLDLKDDTDLATVKRMIARADVLIENFRPGVMERLGLPRATLQALAPELIHLRISGYGREGEGAGRPAFDLAVQAESGLMELTGEEGGEPCRVPNSLADVAAALAGSEACVAALLRRVRVGGGALIDISLLDAIVGLLGFQAQGALLTGDEPRRLGHRHPNLVPYQIFMARDRGFVLAVGTDAQWQDLVQALGRPEGLDAEAWRTNGGRVREREVLVPRLAAIFGQEDFQTWQDRLTSAGVPLGRVRGLTEVLADLKARNDGFRLQLTHASIGRLPMVGGAIVMDGERLASERAPCLADQHRAALLAEFAEAGTRKGDGAT